MDSAARRARLIRALGGKVYVTSATKEKLMNDTQSRKLTGKGLALVVLVAIVTAFAVTLVQKLLLGHANVAVTGGVVGAVAVAMALSTMKKKSGS